MKDPDSIRAAVRRAMHDQKMSQSALSREAGVTQPKLSEWLAGRKTVTTLTASRVMEALGVKLAPPSPTSQGSRKSP